MEFKNIIFEKTPEGVAWVTLNRPEVMNALDATTLEELGAAANDINNDVSVRVVIIKANGKAFCTGADLTAVSTVPEGKPIDYFLRLWHKTFTAIENIGVPVIAMVQGTAYAGGLELTMVCDLVVAAEDARLSDQHANRGLVPAGGATQRLPRLIGIRKAKELLLLGDRITGAEAEKLDLVNKAVPADKVEETVNEIVQNLLGKSPMAAKAVKRLVNKGMDSSLDTGLEAEMLAMTAHGYTEDFKEGIAAFIEKRPAKFPGK